MPEDERHVRMSSAVAGGGGSTSSGEDSEDEAGAGVDYRLLQSMLHKTSSDSAVKNKKDFTLPQRGEKDFEPDGTNKQDRILTASRQAMFDALSVPRDLSAKNYVRADWHADRGVASVDKEYVKGNLFRTVGRADRDNTVWLNAEEALFLVDRGSMEMFWHDTNLPMSVQACYAACLPFVPLHVYSVYAYLRRAGFALQRGSWVDAASTLATTPSSPRPWSFFTALSTIRQRLAALLHLHHLPTWSRHTSVFRSWHALYASLPHGRRPQLASFYKPCPPATSNGLKVVFRVWRPGTAFRKSQPTTADYNLAVVDANATNVVSLAQVEDYFDSLDLDHDSLPVHPPSPHPPSPSTAAAVAKSRHSSTTKTATSTSSPPSPSAPITTLPAKKRSKTQSIKVGVRHGLLAVYDAGIISFLQLGDARFDLQPMYPLHF